ncbi:MAG: hypothetical protein CM15mP120_19000 [Pseudomonadota bacterium]|nr:MAG: hypothetical protein CM15mP120_19000 [Pseudomonadota bacterium]
MVAEQAQYWSDVIKARELMDAGAIGDIISASGNFYDRVANDAPEPRAAGGKSGLAGGGGTLYGAGHGSEPLRMMMGEVDGVIGVARGVIFPKCGASLVPTVAKNSKTGTCNPGLSKRFIFRLGREMFRITGTEGEFKKNRRAVTVN